ncbi:MAG: signal peptidase I [Clostridia bacterium]|nr:signal peptidase I [Clostridia bacterium]
MYKLSAFKLGLLRVIMMVITVFAIVSIAVAGFFIVYIRTPVNGLSMLPTLNLEYEQMGENDMVYINRFNKGEVGDIVVLDLRKHPSFGDYAIKRLVAVEGDVVNITFDASAMQYHLIVNDKIVQSKPHKLFGYNTYSSFEQYINNHKHDLTRVSVDEGDNVKGVIIKSGEIFVLGDNWEESKDSSLVGPLNSNTIVGRVDIVVKPSQNEFFSILKRIF